MRRFALLLAPAIALALVPSIGTVPYRPYELGLTGALALYEIILLAWLAAEGEDLISRSPDRGLTLARLRSLTATPRFAAKLDGPLQACFWQSRSSSLPNRLSEKPIAGRSSMAASL